MTMVECIVVVVLLFALLFVELYRTDPRALLHKPTDENPAFVEIFKRVSKSKTAKK